MVIACLHSCGCSLMCYRLLFDLCLAGFSLSAIAILLHLLVSFPATLARLFFYLVLMFVLALIAYDLFMDAFRIGRRMYRMYRKNYWECLLVAILVVFALLIMPSVYMYLLIPEVLSGWRQWEDFYPTDIYALYLMSLTAAIYIIYYYLDRLVLSRSSDIVKRIDEQ